MVEGAPLLRVYGSKAHRGFESLTLRHPFLNPAMLGAPNRIARQVAAPSSLRVIAFRSALLTQAHFRPAPLPTSLSSGAHGVLERQRAALTAAFLRVIQAGLRATTVGGFGSNGNAGS